MALSMSFTLSSMTEGSVMGFGWTSWERWGGYWGRSDVGFQCWQGAGGLSYSLGGGGPWGPSLPFLLKWLSLVGRWGSASDLPFNSSAFNSSTSDLMSPGGTRGSPEEELLPSIFRESTWPTGRTGGLKRYSGIPLPKGLGSWLMGLGMALSGLGT